MRWKLTAQSFKPYWQSDVGFQCTTCPNALHMKMSMLSLAYSKALIMFSLYSTPATIGAAGVLDIWGVGDC